MAAIIQKFINATVTCTTGAVAGVNVLSGVAVPDGLAVVVKRVSVLMTESSMGTQASYRWALTRNLNEAAMPVFTDNNVVAVGGLNYYLLTSGAAMFPAVEKYQPDEDGIVVIDQALRFVVTHAAGASRTFTVRAEYDFAKVSEIDRLRILQLV